MSEPLVVIGNGMAAMRLVEELSRRALGRHAIALIGDEPGVAYNRVLLSSLLAGEVGAGELQLRSGDWLRSRGVTWMTGRAAVAVDPERRQIQLCDGARLAFSKLVLATGSRAIRLPLPGAELDGVLTFRDLADVERLQGAASAESKAVVIGGGLLGLEAAYGLAKAGLKVDVIHLMDRLMERQLDGPAAAMLQRALEGRGVRVHVRAETAAIIGESRVEGVRLKDGRTLDADIVVMAVGIVPNTALAKSAGLGVGRGIIVDDRLQTSAPDIYAIGECAEHRGVCYGLVEPAYEQARVLAAQLSGSAELYRGSILATNLKVSGVSVFSAGDFLGSPGTEQIVLRDPGLATYKKLVIAHGRLVGAVLFGETNDGLWYLDLIRSGRRIEAFRADLVFGKALAERQAA